MDVKELIFKFIELFTRLILLLDREKEALKKDNAEEVAALLNEKREIALEISQLENKRKELLNEKKIDELVLEGIISSEIAKEFIEKANIVKEKNETNMILTKQSLGYIHLMTNLLSPQKNVTYKQSGTLDANTSSNIFNATV
ncbi:FlgN protein [Caloramator mitchellensis]|uniref:FlgN protein n=1 Tax=Caloramator mitchellensis TaxID=908809 RepID=A0A0R3JR98_CALMK|nr:flagellar protein FlgN [Caloramator mitchellensis]KRQ85990.1 FlgN protein [Caloramator mitchellensis]